MTVWRFSSSLALDGTFGTGGRAVFGGAGTGADLDHGSDIVVDGAGKHTVAGRITIAGGNRNMAVWRLTSAGALDTTFNGTGTTAGRFNDTSNAHSETSTSTGSIVFDSSGRVIVAGSSNTFLDTTIWRLK
jgi:hypothetical protein